MLKKTVLAIGIFSLLSACAVTRTDLDTNPAFTPHRQSNHELDISWKSEKTDTGIRLEGTVKNVRPDLPYNSLQLTAKLLDENRKLLAEGTKTFPNRFVGPEPFTMDLPIAQKEDVRRINFSYSYGTVEDFYRREFDTTP